MGGRVVDQQIDFIEMKEEEIILTFHFILEQGWFKSIVVVSSAQQSNLAIHMLRTHSLPQIFLLKKEVPRVLSPMD